MIVALLVAASLQALPQALPQGQPQARQAARVTLSQAVQAALASHPSVAAARAARDRATADLGDARSAQRPRVSLDASFSQYEKPMVVLPLHGFDLRNPPLFDRSLLQSGASVGWTLYDFGQRAARVRTQDALGSAADASLTTAERQIIARTVNAYVRVLTTRETLAAHDQRIAALDAERTRVQQLLREGKAARVEQLRADAATTNAQADRIATASQLDVAVQELAQLTNLPAAAIAGGSLAALRLGDSTLATDTSAGLRASLIERAKKANSDLAGTREPRARGDVRRRGGARNSVSRASRLGRVRGPGAHTRRLRRGMATRTWAVVSAVHGRRERSGGGARVGGRPGRHGAIARRRIERRVGDRSRARVVA